MSATDLTNETDNQDQSPLGEAPGHPGGGPVFRRIAMAALIVAILGGAIGVAAYWLTRRPQAMRRRPQTHAALVEIQRVQPVEEVVVVQAMGTVVPARSVELASRVGGQIVAVSPKFIPGGRFDADEWMVKVDPEDFRLSLRLRSAQLDKAGADAKQAEVAVAQREADVVGAESNLALEMGHQSAAAGEYELLGETIEPEDEALVLREPQLKQARANCSAAKAAVQAAAAGFEAAKASYAAGEVALDQARLDLQRTQVPSPFNAMVRQRHVNVGAQVAAGSSLASLVGTDRYWVEVSVPVDQLKWIRIPGFNDPVGSKVRVYHAASWGPDTHRTGTVARLMSEIEPEGRMARLLVTVADPLDLLTSRQPRRPLILGSYVRVEFVGRTLQNVVRVQRTALRDGNRVWVMGSDDTLQIRQVKIAWAGNDHVCVSEGLTAGDRLIVSDLGAAVEGLPLRTADTPAASTRPAKRTGPDDRRREARS